MLLAVAAPTKTSAVALEDIPLENDSGGIGSCVRYLNDRVSL